MAYFAKINEENIVEAVIIAEDIAWVNETQEGNWIETFEGERFAGIGWSYNAERNLFLCPEPEGNLGFDDDKYDWITPAWVPPAKN